MHFKLDHMWNWEVIEAWTTIHASSHHNPRRLLWLPALGQSSLFLGTWPVSPSIRAPMSEKFWIRHWIVHVSNNCLFSIWKWKIFRTTTMTATDVFLQAKIARIWTGLGTMSWGQRWSSPTRRTGSSRGSTVRPWRGAPGPQAIHTHSSRVN